MLIRTRSGFRAQLWAKEDRQNHFHIFRMRDKET